MNYNIETLLKDYDRRNIVEVDGSRKGIGGMDTASILNINPYSSPLLMWRMKKGLDKFVTNDAVETGQFMESFIYKKMEEKLTAKHPGSQFFFTPDLYLRHPELPFIVGSIDALGIIDGKLYVIDVKAQYGFRNKFDEGVPEEYYIQLNKYAGLLRDIYKQKYDIDLDIGAFFYVGSSGYKFERVNIEVDFQAYEAYLEIDHHFWYYFFAKNVPPEPLSGDDYKKAYPEAVPQSKIVATKTIISMLGDYLEEKKKLKEIEEEKGKINKNMLAIKDEVRGFMQDYETLEAHEMPLAVYKSSEKSGRRLLIKDSNIRKALE